MGREYPAVTHAQIGPVERCAPEMLDQIEVDHRIHHRHVYLLPVAGALAPDEGHRDGRCLDVTA